MIPITEPIPEAIVYHGKIIDTKDPLIKVLTPKQISGTLDVILEAA